MQVQIRPYIGARSATPYWYLNHLQADSPKQAVISLVDFVVLNADTASLAGTPPLAGRDIFNVLLAPTGTHSCISLYRIGIIACRKENTI